MCVCPSIAHLVHHKASAHDEFAEQSVHCLLVAEDVHEGPYAGTRFLRIVHGPERVLIPRLGGCDGEDSDSDGDDEMCTDSDDSDTSEDDVCQSE